MRMPTLSSPATAARTLRSLVFARPPFSHLLPAAFPLAKCTFPAWEAGEGRRIFCFPVLAPFHPKVALSWAAPALVEQLGRARGSHQAGSPESALKNGPFAFSAPALLSAQRRGAALLLWPLAAPLRLAMRTMHLPMPTRRSQPLFWTFGCH